MSGRLNQQQQTHGSTIKFDPFEAFLLKNTTVHAYPRRRRSRRRHGRGLNENSDDSLMAICRRLVYFVGFYTLLALFFYGYLYVYLYFQVGGSSRNGFHNQ